MTGGERFSWTQTATDVSHFRFFVYVDSTGTRELTDAACQRVGLDRFDCTATVPELTPGPHALAIGATLMSGGEAVPGTRSQPFNVIMTAPAAPSGSPAK
jgi:hypothetical protein